MTKMERKEIIEFCADNNKTEYNLLKALEEANEFSEILLKLMTKHQNNPKRPKEEKAVEEYGDLCYRGLIALLSLFPDMPIDEMMSKIEDRISYKLTELQTFRATNKYKGGL